MRRPPPRAPGWEWNATEGEQDRSPTALAHHSFMQVHPAMMSEETSHHAMEGSMNCNPPFFPPPFSQQFHTAAFFPFGSPSIAAPQPHPSLPIDHPHGVFFYPPLLPHPHPTAAQIVFHGAPNPLHPHPLMPPAMQETHSSLPEQHMPFPVHNRLCHPYGSSFYDPVSGTGSSTSLEPNRDLLRNEEKQDHGPSPQQVRTSVLQTMDEQGDGSRSTKKRILTRKPESPDRKPSNRPEERREVGLRKGFPQAADALDVNRRPLINNEAKRKKREVPTKQRSGPRPGNVDVQYDDHLPEDAVEQLERLLDEVVRADRDMENLSQELRGLNLSMDGESWRRTDDETSLLESGEERLLALDLSPDSPIFSLDQGATHTCHTLKTHEMQGDRSFNLDVSAESAYAREVEEGRGDGGQDSLEEGVSLQEAPDPEADASMRRTLHRSHSDTDALTSPSHTESSRKRELKKSRASKRSMVPESPRSVGDPLLESEQDLLLECSTILSYEMDKLNRSGFVRYNGFFPSKIKKLERILNALTQEDDDLNALHMELRSTLYEESETVRASTP
ncbi:hypothetical protein GUITHDRAFT_116357 [Guillardia theta CCMP2712]|uniref:Uncharacterized protein n=1 Tax=Guillardia theta (strain CCMP2712) TaxID=905079 RepID=L1INT5_GUITC|nr:hypothetical protein GUITHDRAFT_116357 [Guillardia theta CCMP2712]EKX37549.1 hypothetical protein GUITHDRAFT_116357 [Guillardia theta CCMP2712]|eukprot:XP_005824529.1 hypothetical protein GUITHDRAFT_116357 [Guillardia theta CCMP2712]